MPLIGEALAQPRARSIVERMKTILWATLTANGNYATNSREHPPKREALEDFAAQVTRAGSFVVGRRTFESFQAQPSSGPAFGDVSIVVVSKTLAIPGVTCVAGPREALDHLARQGRTSVVIAGGETLHNAFLAAGLVDELVFNIAPVLEPTGLKIVLPAGAYQDATLIGVRELGGGVVQLRYGLARD